MENIVIVTSQKELEMILEKVLEKKFPTSVQVPIEKTFSINQVAKMLGRSHQKICNLVEDGILKATPDKRIFESSIQAYNEKIENHR